MHSSKICALAAVTALASGGAAMAAATQVNVADPTTPGHVAKVEIGNRLAVQEVPPANYYHSAAQSVISCIAIAVPPSGKALIVREVRVHTLSQGGSLALYANAGCVGGLVGEVLFPAAYGYGYAETFDPGIAIPSGGTFSVVSNAYCDVFVDGYTVPSGAVPPVGGQAIQVSGTQQQR